MFFRKSFWTGKNIIFLILAAAVILILPKIINILLMFFGAYILACALNPYVNILMKKMNRTVASSIVLSAGILSVIALFIPIFIVAAKEIRIFLITLPQKAQFLQNFLTNLQIDGNKFTKILEPENIINGSPYFAKDFFSQSLNITVGIAHLVVVLVVLTMVIYYILVDKDYLKKKFLQFFPPDLKNKAETILSHISSRVGAYVRGQILSMVAVGIMVLIVLLIFRVEYATLLALIAGILDLIPVFGPSVALAIIILVAYPMGMVKIVLIIAGFLLSQQLSNYVIKPLLFGKLMKMHPLMIFFALFAANQFLGFWGVILSPAIASTVCVLIDEIYIKPINQISGSENA